MRGVRLHPGFLEGDAPVSEDAVNFVILFAVVLGAVIWWLARDTEDRRSPGSSDHFSSRDPGSRHEKLDK